MLKNKNKSRFVTGNLWMLLTAWVMSMILLQGVGRAKNQPPPRDRAEVKAVMAKAASPSTIFSGKIVLLALDIFKSLSLVDKIGIGGIIDTFNGKNS